MNFYYVYSKKENKLIDKVFKEVGLDRIKEIYNEEDYIVSEIYYEYPKIVDNEIGEMTIEEIQEYRRNNEKITLGYDEKGKITDYIVGEYENTFNNTFIIRYDEEILNNLDYCYILNNELVYRREDKENDELESKKKELINELSKLKNETFEKGFIFKDNLRQPCREQDKTSVTAKILEMQLMKTPIVEWKFFDIENNHIYLNLTIQDLVQIGIKMGTLVTNAMKVESALIEEIKALSLENIDNFKLENKFEEKISSSEVKVN